MRRLRAYENETGPVTLRGLRDDAAREIVSWRLMAIVAAVVSLLPWLVLHSKGVECQMRGDAAAAKAQILSFSDF